MQLARTTNDLGITSATGKECMRVLHDCFEKACISHGEAERQFRRWHDGFIKFHGNLLERETIKADFDGIASRLLGRKQSVDPARFLFILYTYHALVIKIIAANVVLRVQDAKPEIRIRNRLSPNSVDEFLHSIENNEFYKDSAGIINFLGDFCFSWYLNVLDNESKTAMQRLVTDVNQLAANSMEKRETTACEILRTLHQAIIPRKIRHDLGEYYTPSWLARLVIEESGYSGDMSQNVLDPGCGSGTFLLELIALMRSAGSTKHDARSLLDAILTRIKGFDVNPIAVLAAKTSFLIGIQELIPGCSVPFEIPVFLVDSMIGTPAALKQLNVLEEVDLVVGNPPWIKWEFLAVDYKASLATTVLNEYTLFNYSGMQAGLGFAHDDISIAFTYVCIDRYLKKGGVLAFVLKQTMYKGIAGKEFRKFTIEKNGESTPVQIIKVHDLRALKPFKSIADAETSIAIIKKGTATRYPVPYYSWQMNHGVHLHDSMALDAVKSLTTMKKYDAWPDLAMNDITAPWILADEGVSPPVIPKGKNCYIARHGVVND
nr:N-6 DNA methylase [Candidatus Sigynarchaeota archaeon]